MTTLPFTHAQWIAPSEATTVCMIQRNFALDHIPSDAILSVTGLGYFNAVLNGYPLGEEYFQPLVSDYHVREFENITYPCTDTFTHRIYYRQFPVSTLLKQGENRLELSLGGGFYVQNERVAEGDMGYGDRPICIFSLSAPGFEMTSDGSEVWYIGDLRWSNLFIGEHHDPTAPHVLHPVNVIRAPEAELTLQTAPPDRLIRTVKPTLLGIRGGRAVYDIGENTSGIVRIRTKRGYKGTVTLRFAENLTDCGTPDFATTGSDYECRSGMRQIMTDTFVCDGSERSFAPQFVWHAFRYFDVEGEIADAEMLVIHADLPVISAFESDSEGLNFLYDSYIRGQLSNIHGGIPSDCPHRERLGYTGDGQITAPTAMLLLDCKAFYRKWIRDILDCQDLKTGHVQHTAPFQGGGGGPGGWGCAIVLVPYDYWKQYGETDILADCYTPMLRWIAYLEAHSENGLVVREAEGGWCLGDWCTLETCRLPEPFVNTFYLVKSIRCLLEIADVLGISEHRAYLQKLEAEAVTALRRTYFHPETGHWCDGTQGADAYAAALGLQDVGVCADYYAKLGHFDTGFLATDVLCEVLFQNGYGEVAYKLLSGEECGSYLWMKRHGATTIWESWNGGSHNHPMFGACTRQLFHGILGICQPENSAGWKHVTVKPFLPHNMNYAKGTLTLPTGNITVTLRRGADGCVSVKVDTAENMVCEIG